MSPLPEIPRRETGLRCPKCGIDRYWLETCHSKVLPAIDACEHPFHGVRLIREARLTRARERDRGR